MILSENLVKTLQKNNIRFYSGVPDSILKPLSQIIDKRSKTENIVAVNEGSAVSIGIGYHLSTKKIPCIYFQNSGLGNALNPLVSLCHKNVYSIPLLLLIGWRGAPKSNDEPQHITKGLITPNILSLLKIKYIELKNHKDLNKLKSLINFSKKNNVPVACLIKKNYLSSKEKMITSKNNHYFSRQIFINHLLKALNKNSKIISTTGYTSRELEMLKNKKKFKNIKTFYMVGGMGHASAVTLGASIFDTKNLICLDGDGSALMHLGALRTAGHFANKNFKHIILNNNSHESVGGTSTTAGKINFKLLSKSLGYKNFFEIKKKNELKRISLFLKSKGPSLMNVFINQGTIKNLERPNNLIKIKSKFINNI